MFGLCIINRGQPSPTGLVWKSEPDDIPFIPWSSIKVPQMDELGNEDANIETT
ncbi:hypothetical protein P692DRAFT_20827070 [Suillus brevipes Sb2]|nr:hypothetical protein P692DRAFT_20827070 [Suillus brevipes Sb2]